MNKNTKYAIAAVLTLLFLAFAYYAISPLFRILEVDEVVPESAVMSSAAEVVGTAAHPASGSVRIVEADGTTYIRYEDYETINGPDIFVYLAKDLDADEFINLGKVRATKGNVNYQVPDDVDVSEYRYVLTWCRAFGVLFNYAEISS